jgi:outer membrane protein OmpA-like peptidoglycan-associated protein
LRSSSPRCPSPPTVALQVASVEPDRVFVGESTKATVFGEAFEKGARVWVDESEVAGVTWRDANRLSVVLPPLSSGAHDIRVANPDGSSARLRSGIVAREKLTADPTAGLQCDKITVQFDFDKSTITSDSASQLQKHLACFTTREGTIRVEGHCDERGLTSNGVTPSRIRAVSYGEERPVDSGHSESSWQKNRRAELFPAR